MSLFVEPMSKLMLLRFKVEVGMRTRVAILAHQLYVKYGARHIRAAMLLALDLLRKPLVR